MNIKRKLFIDYYIQTKNATEAAKKAGYSNKTARSQGQRLLTFDDVAKEVSDRFEKIRREEAITKSNIVSRLWNIGKQADRPSDRTVALMGVAKILGLVTDKSEFTGKIEHTQTEIEEYNKLKNRVSDIN